MSAGRNERALEELARVVQEDTNDTRTWLKMAEIHARAGALDQARDIYLRTAEIYVEQGFLQKAATVYKSVLKLTPGLPQVRERLAEIYKRLGLVADALRELQLRRRRAPACRAAERCACPRCAGSWGCTPTTSCRASSWRRPRRRSAPSTRRFTSCASPPISSRLQGRADEYVRVAERLLFHRPNDFSVARELATAYIARRNPRLALAKLQAALKAAPRDPRNVALLAEALAQLDPPKAISVWRELAEIQDAAGQPADRDASIRAALALDPTDGETRELAARWGVATGSAGAPAGARLFPPPRVERERGRAAANATADSDRADAGRRRCRGFGFGVSACLA